MRARRISFVVNDYADLERAAAALVASLEKIKKLRAEWPTFTRWGCDGVRFDAVPVPESSE